MLYLFDLDGTLISSYMDNADRHYHTWQRLPRRFDTIRTLRAHGHSLGIVTNQGGVAFGLVSEADVKAKLCQVAAQFNVGFIELHDGSNGDDGEVIDAAPWPCGGEIAVYVCYGDRRSTDARYQDDSRRKPCAAMLTEASRRWDAADVLFVGDRPEDEQAARAAGVAFRWAEDFFADDADGQ
jgi:D-glycero-D-manno-heptose 1,7-bisphosphate phosphatase